MIIYLSLTCHLVELQLIRNTWQHEACLQHDAHKETNPQHVSHTETGPLKGNSGIFKPRPYFWHEIRSSTHREQFGESRRPSEAI